MLNILKVSHIHRTYATRKNYSFFEIVGGKAKVLLPLIFYITFLFLHYKLKSTNMSMELTESQLK